MTPVINARVIFNSVPEGYPEPGKTTVYDTTQTIDLDTAPLNGGVLLKILEVSIDPYLRGKMRAPIEKSYSPPFTLGEPIDSFAVAVVVRSEKEGFKKGNHVYGILPTEELRILNNKHNLPWSVYVGAAGMPGKSAYMAWKEYSYAKKGETVYVSTGAGPVGSTSSSFSSHRLLSSPQTPFVLVIQLAKQSGCRVIGSAGSDDKVTFMKECGADVAFNYKTESVWDVLEREGGLICSYWDNVGGDTLDAALEFAKIGGRFIECGMISGYNTGGAVIKNILHVVDKSLSIYGFVVFRLHEKYETQFYEEVPQLLAEGKLKYSEHVWEGLDKAGEAILAVQKGLNRAKAVVKVAQE
ncbi:hypothetical protein BDQ17DRAFT_1335544 [Cyathus striatus]|nr:hypothetical protein BDQ17DRAFT_1335544 [Cyathus striatus]